MSSCPGGHPPTETVLIHEDNHHPRAMLFYVGSLSLGKHGIKATQRCMH